ncbi:sensor histidine kinase [Natrialbaceae archaeon A-arb3/5]
MEHDELVAAFGQTVGVEKADALIETALAELEMDRMESYSTHEVADICETIARTTDGYLAIVANELRVRETAKRRFDALLERVTDPVVSVSFRKSEPIVTALNPAFEATFDYGPGAIGRPLSELIVPDDDRSETVDRWLRSDDGGTEVERLTADGERRTFLFQSVIVSGFDGEVGGYGIYTDITERKRRERRLERQNEQLERFVSVVSHDLRNPLTVAQGNADLVRDMISDPDVCEHLDQVVAAHERMETLIDDLLTLASQGRIVDDPQPVRLRPVIENAWRYVETAGATLVVDLPDELTIDGDAERLRQLFENLFRNAVEHGRSADAATDTSENTPATSEQSTDSTEADVTVRIGWDDGVLVVEDDGPGIDPSEREDVFEHGYTSSAEGTGFGLAIVAAITDSHGWTIDVTDGDLGGAAFLLRGISVHRSG